ncbi:MAG: uroporphyrinogen-III synthase [Pseudomonadota bacterium]
MASVLVTRPAGQEESLSSAVAAMGHSVHHFALMRIQALAELSPDAMASIQDLERYQHVIFISSNAVRLGMGWIEAYWPQLPTDMHWYAVGNSTAKDLEAYGLKPEIPVSDMSSEGLLALPQLSEVNGHRVLIVKGVGGRQTLAHVLTARGAMVHELACYRREMAVAATGYLAQRLNAWDTDLVMITSGEGLRNMLSLLSPAETSKFSAVAMLVPSARVADIARRSGFTRVIVAENASDEAMLHALSEYYSSAGE